jgi:predicted amidohydrolase
VVSHGADAIFFPELSLTGYEPTLAHDLAMEAGDRRLEPFQEGSDRHQILIGAGIPERCEGGICIGMILFQPGRTREVYTKKYLHPDEEEFFVIGQGHPGLLNTVPVIALAICYELSVPEHPANAARRGAGIYVASVAKTTPGVVQAGEILSWIARTYSMTVLMSNCIGLADGTECTGGSAIWDSRGRLLGELSDSEEGLIMIHTDTHQITYL